MASQVLLLLVLIGLGVYFYMTNAKVKAGVDEKLASLLNRTRKDGKESLVSPTRGQMDGGGGRFSNALNEESLNAAAGNSIFDQMDESDSAGL